jgi:hypothetical protein
VFSIRDKIVASLEKMRHRAVFGALSDFVKAESILLSAGSKRELRASGQERKGENARPVGRTLRQRDT